MWSEDYQGPFAASAIGGYTGRYVFVEFSRGFLIVFLVKAKTELTSSSNVLGNYHRYFAKRIIGKLPLENSAFEAILQK